MRRAAVILAGALIATALAVGVVAARLRSQEPLGALPREAPDGLTTVERWEDRWQGRTLLHVALDGAAVGRVRFVVSLPDPLPSTSIPLVIVAGGLRGGSDAIRELADVAGDPGPNAIVGFDWPLPRREPDVLEIALRLPELRRDVLAVPGQVDALLCWISREPWADPRRVSLLGYSLGAFVVPAAQRVVEARGGSIPWTVLAYAGAPIGAVIAGHPGVKPRWLAPVLGAAADLLLRPVEPSLHLPHLRGRFLLLGARTDRLIAPAAAERLRALTPQPRTVVLLEGDHMGVGPNKLKLLEEVIAVSRAWLVEQGAIEPPMAWRRSGRAPRLRERGGRGDGRRRTVSP